MLSAVCRGLTIPVIASGGAGKKEDFLQLFKTVQEADAGLAASVFHFKEINIGRLKDYLSANLIPVRV